MTEIRVLDNNLINKIAAGEVVERPASVVKELCENSIDAGASKIVVEIEDGGTSLMRISDNGKGIPAQQVKTAFLRHATSKVACEQDLESIFTLGFRGEALSSIAAVAMTSMVTKFVDEEIGTSIEIHGGVVISEGEIARNTGTDITVRNLFFNVPARRKFLKKPGTEGAYVTDVLTRLALARPDIAFEYINNGAHIFSTTGSKKVKNAILSLYGRDVSNKLLEVNYSKGFITVTGFIGKPEIARKNRNHGSFFINGRYVKNHIMQTAVETAFKSRVMNGKFPVFVIYVDMPVDLLDVNVHPTKLEVRFSNDIDMFKIIFSAVEKSFQEQNLVPEIRLSENSLIRKLPFEEKYRPQQIIEKKIEMDSPLVEIKEAFQPIRNVPENIAPVPNEYVQTDFSGKDILQKQKHSFFYNYKIIGQIFNTYWLIEQDSSFYVIDQHAAHERAVFEEVKEKLTRSGALPQKITSPIAIKLTGAEMQAVKDNMKLLINMGFEIEDMYDNNIAVRSVPYIFQNPASGTFFMEIVDLLMKEESIENIYGAKEDAISQISCKAAVKANDRLSQAEAKALVEKMLELENPFTCPHGRPVMVEIKKYELEKMFKRVT